VERPRRKERFARLIHRRVRVLGGPAVRAACGGNLSLPWLLLRVVTDECGCGATAGPIGCEMDMEDKVLDQDWEEAFFVEKCLGCFTAVVAQS
jgi:hypothetical protein